MNAQLDLPASRSPAWAALRIWAATIRDEEPALQKQAVALVSMLDCFDDQRDNEVLAPSLWSTSVLLAQEMRKRAQTPFPTRQTQTTG